MVGWQLSSTAIEFQNRFDTIWVKDNRILYIRISPISPYLESFTKSIIFPSSVLLFRDELINNVETNNID